MVNKRNLLNITAGTLIILNTLSLWYQKSVIKDLKSDLENQYYKINTLSNELNARISVFSEDLEALKTNQKWILNKNYKLLSYEAKNGDIKLSFTWTLKDAPSNSKVFLAYGEMDGTSPDNANWKKVSATDDKSLNYNAEVVLTRNQNYMFKVIAEGSSGTKSDTLLDLPLIEMNKNRFSLIGQAGKTSYPGFNHHVYLINNNKDIEFLGIKSAIAEVYVKGLLQNKVELYKANKNDFPNDKYSSATLKPGQEVWLNDEAIWVNGEDKWVQGKDNTWKNEGNVPEAYSDDVKIKVTVVDNLGETQTLDFPRK